MASLVLGAAGTLIAGPIGGLIGGAIGTVIDSKLLRPRLEAPSPYDLMVEASTMGVVIPRPYGRVKLAGNLIMSTPLVAVEMNNGKKGGGKGAVTGSSSQPYYAYYANCAVGICAGPIQNIWRIYADSKVIWDMNPGFTTGGSNDQPVVLSNYAPFGNGVGGVAIFYQYGQGKQQNEQNAVSSGVFYYGTEAQNPDPYLEMLFAPQPVTAFRGLAYVVFEFLPLQYFGNRIPQFTFEVNGFFPGGNTVFGGITLPGVDDGEFQVIADPISNVLWSFAGVTIDATNMQTVANMAFVDPIPGSGSPPNYFASSAGAVDANQNIWLEIGGGPPYQICEVSPYIGALLTFPLPDFSALLGAGAPFGGITCWLGTTGFLVAVDDSNGVFYILQNNYPGYQTAVGDARPITAFVGRITSGSQLLFATAANVLETAQGAVSPPAPIGGSIGTAATSWAFPTSAVWAGPRNQLVLLDGINGVQWVLELSGDSFTLVGQASLSALDSGVYYINYDPVNDIFLYCSDTDVYSVIDPLNPAGWSFNLTASGLDGSAFDRPQTFFPNQNPQGFIAVATTASNVYLLDTSDITVFFGGVYDDTNPFNWATPPDPPASILFPTTNAAQDMGTGALIWNPTGVGAINYATAGGTEGWAIWRAGGYPIPLSTVVADILTRSGLDGSQYDLSAATDWLWGYAISSEGSARAALEPLQELYLFDLVESGGQLVFTYRSLAAATPIALTIDENDLGARALHPGESPGDNAVPKVVDTRKQDLDLPYKVILRYRTTDGNFYVSDFCMEIATQYAMRNTQTVSTVAAVSVNTPIVLDDTHAAQIISQVLMQQWMARTTVEFSLPIKYIAIEPGDVVAINWTAQDEEGDSDVSSYAVYIQEALIGADNTIKFTGVASSANVYSSSAQGSGAVLTYQGFPTGQPTTLDIAEMPPLRDQDDSVGGYWGMCSVGSSPGWNALLEKSVDGGATYAVLSSQGTPALIGYATTALAGPAPAAPWDLVNTVTIKPLAGTPIGEPPVSVLNGSGVYLIGTEIVGASVVVDNMDGTYTLSTLRRGIQGTDVNSGAHAAGEKVMLLSLNGSIQSLDLQMNEVGAIEFYKGVSAGANPTGVPAQEIIPTGLRIKPEAAASWHIAYDMSGNATITWIPRNRINYEWLDGIEQASDEPIEGYSIDIYKSGVVVRTITSWSVITGTVGSLSGQDTGRRTASYSAAQQTSDGLTPGGPIACSIYETSSRIGRGIARTFTQ